MTLLNMLERMEPKEKIIIVRLDNKGIGHNNIECSGAVLTEILNGVRYNDNIIEITVRDNIIKVYI